MICCISLISTFWRCWCWLSQAKASHCTAIFNRMIKGGIDFYASVLTTALAGDFVFSGFPFVHPILVNMSSLKRLEGISSNFA